MRRTQRLIEIDSPMQRPGMVADAVGAALSDGWRVVQMIEVRALSPVNHQPITSSIVVLLERPVRRPEATE